MMWQAFDMIKKLTNENLYSRNDGSPYEKLNIIYNTYRHFSPSDVANQGNLHAIWLTNEGIKTSTHEILCSEISALLIEIGNIANKISKAGK